jgi:hypothetical protein
MKPIYVSLLLFLCAGLLITACDSTLVETEAGADAAVSALDVVPDKTRGQYVLSSPDAIAMMSEIQRQGTVLIPLPSEPRACTCEDAMPIKGTTCASCTVDEGGGCFCQFKFRTPN